MFASTLLGMIWSNRELESPEEMERQMGGELLDEVVSVGGIGAATIFAGVRALAGPDLAAKAADLGDALTAEGMPPPEWATKIGSFEIVRTAVMREEVFDDGRTYFIESRLAGGGTDAIGIYVDHNLGCSAKDLIPAESIERVRETLAAHSDEAPVEMVIEDLEPETLSARVRAALELTDMTIAPIVEDHYGEFRALAFSRVRALPEVEPDPGFGELSEREREELVEEFLASPEGQEIEPGSDALGVVESAIDHCAGYVDGRPLRWSPVTVELFMTSWLPRKVIADADFFAAVPDALAAWIRFAGRKREQPVKSIGLTLAAITDHEPEMLELVNDPEGAEPSTQLIAAMQGAGVDLSDEQAVEAFLAGWNARSGLD